MDWSEEEKRALRDAHAEMNGIHGPYATQTICAVATKAVELVTARGGMMTAEQIDKAFDPLLACGETTALANHIRAQGARVAVLEAERDEWFKRSTVAETMRDLHREERDTARKSADELQRQRDSRGEAIEALEQQNAEARERLETRTAELKEQRDDALRLLATRVEASRLDEANVEIRNLQERLKGEEDGNRELVRRAQQAETERDQWKTEHGSAMRRWKAERERADTLDKRCAALSAAGQVLSEHVDKEAVVTESEAYGLLRTGSDARYPQRHPHVFAPNGDGFCTWFREGDTGECGYPEHQHRYPCSATCTHEDAATPGHAERVRERSEAVKEAVSQEDHTDGILTAAFSGYDDGAEAMRAACLGAVRTRLEVMGALDVYEAVKSAIEGAAP